jgi:hypothetical protein
MMAAAVSLGHTAGDVLFGEPEVARDIVREERTVNPDMLGYGVPHEELIMAMRHG